MPEPDETGDETMMEQGETRSRIEKLEWAEDHLRQAIEYIAEAVEGTSHQSNVEAYTIAHLRNWKDGENPYDTTIPKIREWLLDDAGIDADDFDGIRRIDI